jgi:hypothetical protein
MDPTVCDIQKILKKKTLIVSGEVRVFLVTSGTLTKTKVPQ